MINLYPFSLFRKVGDLIFIAGQIAVKDDKLVAGGIREQTAQVIRNIEKILVENALSLKNIVDVTVFLVEQGDYNDFNDEYTNFFQDPYPTRATIIVKGLPRDAKVEIKVIASK